MERAICKRTAKHAFRPQDLSLVGCVRGGWCRKLAGIPEMSIERGKTHIRIRMAVPDDASSISAILYESFIEYRSSYTQEAFTATTPTGDQIQNRMEEGPMWVALQDDTIVGTAAAVPRDGALYIRGMAILPAARGQRIGESLLRQIETFASERGFKRLFLSTTPFLNRAIRLYEQYGFRHCTEGPHELFGTPLVTMEKFLEFSAQSNETTKVSHV